MHPSVVLIDTVFNEVAQVTSVQPSLMLNLAHEVYTFGLNLQLNQHTKIVIFNSILPQSAGMPADK